MRTALVCVGALTVANGLVVFVIVVVDQYERWQRHRYIARRTL